MAQDKNKFSKAKVYSIYAFSLLFGFAIIIKIVSLMYFEGPELRKRSEKQHIRVEKINALRGNIYSSDNVLLASSYPYFDVRLDLSTKTVHDTTFKKNIMPLCDSLVKMFGGNRKQFYQKIMQARNADNRYLLLKRNLRYEQITRIAHFPLLKKGATFSVEKKQKRQNSGLAYRTVGYYNVESQKGVGLELAYNKYLTGTSGERVMQRITRGVERPVYDFNTVEPKNGNDIISTIDARIQDIAQSALKECMLENEAQHGTVALMEVATGKIISIANYTKTEDGVFSEDYNYAIGESIEPGSTYKLASVMAVLEQGKYNSETMVSTGSRQYGNRQMFDSRREGYGRITLKEAFEKSSNVGISELAEKTFSSNPQIFVDYMGKLGLTKKQGIEIPGEGTPSTNTVGSKTWSKATSIPWMSIGYEVTATPLQILSLYNAVANNGTLLLPQFISEIRHGGELVHSFEPIVLNKEICSKKTLSQIREMLEGVVEKGTAKSLSTSIYKIAGKTGTAQINYQSRNKEKMQYRASFVGYFPAENPKYSCIVMISNPQKNHQYGGEVAAPVFKTIADKVYATFLKEHVADNGDTESFAKTDTIKMKSIKQVYTIPGQMPNVIGLSARAAVYLLEEQGLKVVVKGYGKVTSQSLAQGDEYKKGQTVALTLN